MDQNKSGIDMSGEVDDSAARVWTGFGKSRWLQMSCLKDELQRRFRWTFSGRASGVDKR